MLILFEAQFEEVVQTHTVHLGGRIMNKRLKKKLIDKTNEFEQGSIYSNGIDIRWVIYCEKGKVHYISNPKIGMYPQQKMPYKRCNINVFRKWAKKNIGYSGSSRPGFLGLG